MSLSVAETSLSLLKKLVPSALVPGGFSYGPSTITNVAAGTISCQEQGYWKVDPYVPLVYPRILVRCVAPTEEQADLVKGAVVDAFDDFTRTVVEQDSTLERFLVSVGIVKAGPSFGPAEQRAYWEMRLIVELMICKEPA